MYEDNIRHEWLKACAEPSKYLHLMKRTTVHDAAAERDVKDAAWWDADLPEPLALAAFAICQFYG